MRFNVKSNQKNDAAVNRQGGGGGGSKPNAIKNLAELANQANLSFDDKIRPILGKALNRELPKEPLSPQTTTSTVTRGPFSWI